MEFNTFRLVGWNTMKTGTEDDASCLNGAEGKYLLTPFLHQLLCVAL